MKNYSRRSYIFTCFNRSCYRSYSHVCMYCVIRVVYMCVCVCTCVCMCVCVCVCVFVCMYVCCFLCVHFVCCVLTCVVCMHVFCALMCMWCVCVLCVFVLSDVKSNFLYSYNHQFMTVNQQVGCCTGNNIGCSQFCHNFPDCVHS